jgi:hypothetical protein
MRAHALLAVLVLAPLTDAMAQDQPLQPGQRVRVTAPGLGINRQVATFDGLAGDALVVTADSTMRWPLANVTRLDVHRGRGVSATRWVAMSVGGLALGAGIGWGIGKAIDESCEGTFCLDLAQGWGLGVGAAIGFVAGFTAGALIKTDRWEEVPLDRLRVSVGPQRGGRGFALGVAVRF